MLYSITLVEYFTHWKYREQKVTGAMNSMLALGLYRPARLSHELIILNNKIIMLIGFVYYNYVLSWPTSLDAVVGHMNGEVYLWRDVVRHYWLFLLFIFSVLILKLTLFCWVYTTHTHNASTNIHLISFSVIIHIYRPSKIALSPIIWLWPDLPCPAYSLCCHQSRCDYRLLILPGLDTHLYTTCWRHCESSL